VTPDTQQAESSEPVGRTRFIVGAVLLVGGFLSPLALPLVRASNLSAEWKALLSTGLVAGIPEIGMLAAAAVLGKQGFQQLKQGIWGLLRRHTAAANVSRARYRFGLFLFWAPVMLGFLAPYLIYFFPALAFDALWPVLVSDLVFGCSLLVLGAGFWEKVRRLFTYDPAPANGEGRV